MDKIEKVKEMCEKMDNCIKTCDDVELTEDGLDVFDGYVDAYNKWVKTIGKYSGPKSEVENILKLIKKHNKIVNDIVDFSCCCDGSELTDLTWEYLPKLVKASRSLTKTFSESSLRCAE